MIRWNAALATILLSIVTLAGCAGPPEVGVSPPEAPHDGPAASEPDDGAGSGTAPPERPILDGPPERHPAEGSELALWYLDPYDERQGKSLDAGPDGLHLRHDEDMAYGLAPAERFGHGLVFVDGGDHLTFDDPALCLTGDLSAIMAFEVAEITGDVLLMGCGARGETEATNYVYEIRINADGTLMYKHEHGAGSDVTFTSTVVVEPGFHTMSVRRDASEGIVSIHVDGEETVVGVWLFVQAPSGGQSGFFSMGRYANVGNLVGAVYEARVWDRAVDQDILDALLAY